MQQNRSERTNSKYKKNTATLCHFHVYSITKLLGNILRSQTMDLFQSAI